MSFLKISDSVKRDSIVKEYLELKKNIGMIYSQREPENNNHKPIFQSFIDLLLKRKKLKLKRLRQDLGLSKKVSRTYHRLLNFHLRNLSEKHREKKRKMRKI